MELAGRIKAIRESLGYSQKDMALAIDSSLPSVQNYESGKSIPGGNVFEALVKLGFNANWLLTGKGKMRVDYPLSEGLKTGDILSERARGESISQLKPDLSWFYEWIEEELHGKTISEIMGIAVKIKAVLDEGRGK